MVPITHNTPILIAGGGPVGLMLAYELSRLGVPCLLAEKALETTKWPKMDLTNCRTMEILRMWGLADEYRTLGVPSIYKFNEHLVTSMGPRGKCIATWNLKSVDDWRKEIQMRNDGTQPAEPYQRCSQIIFEDWMKKKVIEQPLIDSHFGMKFISATETTEGVESHLVDLEGREHIVRSQYLVGADGGGSIVRRTAGIKLEGGPLPLVMFLVHFRSKDLAKRRPFGRFWHLIFPNGGFIIDQDEDDTFTSHLPIRDLSTDVTKIDPREAVYKCLGGIDEPFEFEIDEILVSSAWRPSFSIADRYISDGGRILLAGDSAHRTHPRGGFGMNFGVEEAVNLGFKLAAAVKGYGGPFLLPSYANERRPAMIRALERSDELMHMHRVWFAMLSESRGLMNEDSEAGQTTRQRLADFIAEHESSASRENLGIEIGSRYSGPTIYRDVCSMAEPAWRVSEFIPTTWPGSRAPHVLLKDGKTSIIDLYGPEWTIVEFTAGSAKPLALDAFSKEASARNLPLKVVHLQDEGNARSVWERDIVLIRPDGYVAWRSELHRIDVDVEDVLDVVLGHKSCPGWVAKEASGKFKSIIKAVENFPDGDPKFLAAFQQEVN